jgi:hypothetical protein
LVSALHGAWSDALLKLAELEKSKAPAREIRAQDKKVRALQKLLDSEK